LQTERANLRICLLLTDLNLFKRTSNLTGTESNVSHQEDLAHQISSIKIEQ